MFERRNLKPQDNKVEFNVNSALRNIIQREPSVVDEFYFEKCSPSDDNNESVSVVDPIHMMFNQQRLDNMGVTAAKAFIDSLVPQSNSLAELRQKCSDEDLMKMVKSKHLQSPAEILHWCRYINENVEQFNSEYAKLVAEQQAVGANKSVESAANEAAQTS